MTAPGSDGPDAHPRLDELFRAWDRERLAWCLLRGEAELDRPSGDVDILVAPADAERLRTAAGRLGFARLPAPGHATHRFLIAYDRPTDTWIKLDVVTELAFGPSFAYRLPSVATGSCLDRRQRTGPAFALDARDGFWAGLLHGLLDKPRIEDAEIARLQGMAEPARDTGPLARAVAKLLPSGWTTDGVIDAVVAGDRDGLAVVAAGLARSWRRRSPVGTTARRIDSGVRRRAGRAARVRHPRGLAIVLAGEPDLTRRLADGLRRDVPMPVRIVARPAGPASIATRVRTSLRVGSGLVVRCVPAGTDPPGGSSVSRPDLVIVLRPGGSEALPDRRASAGDGGSAEARSIATASRILDATDPEDDLAREVSGLVWERLSARWDALEGGRSR